MGGERCLQSPPRYRRGRARPAGTAAAITRRGTWAAHAARAGMSYLPSTTLPLKLKRPCADPPEEALDRRCGIFIKVDGVLLAQHFARSREACLLEG